MAEYYPPPAGLHYGYYQTPPPPPPPPPPGGVVAPPTQPYMPQPQPPPLGSYSASFPAYGSYDEVRTLFVAGLPEDVKPREIYNLFREFPGYESSHLRSSTQNSQPFAFAVFSDQQSALGAMYALNNNSSAPSGPKNVTPCATLFVANLGPTCTEQELTQVFSKCPGFLKLKIQSTYGPPVAFVDFQDTVSSTAALNNLQGTILYSSPTSDGIRLEFRLMRNLDLQNQGWECLGRPSNCNGVDK
ncbi:putative RNA-binding protein [Citrus sinensis]|nr:putative RNA-binding protein [Citrus sinensis]